VIGSNLLERLASADGLHGDSGLELRIVGCTFFNEWEDPAQSRRPPPEG